MVGEISLQIAGGPDAPGDARTALMRSYPELPAELMQVVMLLTSELVSNAVKHAEADSIEMRCAVGPQHVRVEVSDEGQGFARAVIAPDPSIDGGWGLYLVDELSTRWGIVGGAGGRVWFEIDR